MAAIDDLNTAVKQLASDVQALIAKQGGTSDAAIQAVTTQVTALDTQVQGVLNPPPA